MDGNEVNHCPNCGQDSPSNTNFCIKCGSAFVASGLKTFPGRPVISMDSQKQGHLPANSSDYSYQNQNPQTPQFQPLANSLQVRNRGKQQNKIVVGAVGALVAVLALFLVFGKSSSSSQSVTPNTQQSGTDYVPASTENSQYYSSYDNYPQEFRDAFVNSCIDGSQYDYCVCVLEGLEATYSADELMYLFDSGDSTYMNAAVLSCI